MFMPTHNRGATIPEIKAAYRKLALALHPDRHDGCDIKTRAFKEASEAYNILIDNNRRREYDMSNGVAPSGWYNKNRRRPPPVNYRKVYAPHAPPDGKWHDAQRHYDMHYGEGMFREAVKSAYDRAKAAGELDYNSPLGKGFSFENSEDRKSRYGQNSYFKNPYSKADQGPPSQQYQYEESYISEAKITRREKIVSNLHERRQERIDKEMVEAAPAYPGQRAYQPFNQQNNASCHIM
jgi:curved DNA-binding protein CbpA